MPMNGLSELIQLTLGFELVLVGVEKLVPRACAILPLGGDHPTQIGMLLVLAIGLSEVTSALALWFLW